MFILFSCILALAAKGYKIHLLKRNKMSSWKFTQAAYFTQMTLYNVWSVSVKIDWNEPVKACIKKLNIGIYVHLIRNFYKKQEVL
mgnify:CR=1 FL=1